MTWFLLILSFLIAVVSQAIVSSTFKKYLKVPAKRGLTGEQVARKMLAANGMENMIIERERKRLGDHYDPRRKIMRLSNEVYDGRSIAAIAVAAHETGHAIQHHQKHVSLTFRSLIAGPVSMASKLSYFLILGGIILTVVSTTPWGGTLLNIGILLFAAVVFFNLITLPVEFGASKIALSQLKDGKFLFPDEVGQAQKVLTAAAMTYVAALAVSMLELIRLVLIARNN